MTHIINSWMFNDTVAINALHQIFLYNSRALLLLLCCFIFLRGFKVSASAKHFLFSIAIASMVLIPLLCKLMPAVDIIIDTKQPVLLEALANPTILGLEASYTKITPSSMQASSLLLATYLLITFIIILKLCTDNFKMWLLTKFSTPVKQIYWQRALQQHTQTLGINRPVVILHSPLVTSPSTWGALQPVIFIPSNAVQWPDHLITSTLLHELAHIKRYDWLVQQLAKCICAAYWVNPLCWRAFKHLDTNAETASDNIAITTGLHKTRYANDLLHVAEHVHSHIKVNYAALNMATAHKHTQLSNRVLDILSPDALHTPMGRIKGCVIAFAIVFLMLPFVSLRANFIEKVHITIPAETTKPLESKAKNVSATASLDNVNSALPNNVNTPENEYNAATPLSGELLPVIALERKENLTTAQTSEPIIITRLQTISTSEIIERFSNKFLKNPTKHTVNEGKPAIASDVHTIPVLTTNSLKSIKPRNIESEALSLSTINTPIELPKIRTAFLKKSSPKVLVIPKYPRRALARGLESEVTVEYSLDKFGKVVAAEVVSGGTSRAFNLAAIKAIKKSTFNPRVLNGFPVATIGLQEKYVFVLKS